MKKVILNRLLFFSLMFFTVISVAQQITGTVVSESNEPLIGVNIVVKGTANGTTSDFDGNFTLKVSEFPVTLEATSVGYATLQKQVSQAGTLNLVMKEDATSLEEVVITGLAGTTVKRSNAANAVASVSSEELTGRTPPQTLDGALSGKFAGAQITSSSGAPGGGMSVKLRGITSINGNSQPLYIIDGVYVNNSSISAAGLNAVSGAASGGSASNQDNPSNRIADINPDDIETVEILKGASAAAIYGSRAAAGVVIITTKKGKQGETKINFSQAVGVSQAIRLQGMRDWTEERVFNQYYSPDKDPVEDAKNKAKAQAQVDLYKAALANGTYTDYEKEIFGENGILYKTNLNISGGNAKTSFFGGFTNSSEDGIVKNTGADKKSFRLNVDHKITDAIKLGLTSNYINSSADRGFFNNDNTGTTLGVALTATRPWDQLFPDAAGNYPDHANNSSNPIHTRDVMVNNENINRLIAGANLDVKLWSNEKNSLKTVISAGVDRYTHKTKVFFPRNLQFMNPKVGGVDGLTADGSTVNKDENFSAFLVHNYNSDKEVSFTTQGGVTKQNFSRNTVRSTSTALIASEQNVDQAANIGVSQFRLEQEDAGFFIQEEVNFRDLVIGTIGIRGDKSSNNGDANELFYYPKASVAFSPSKFWADKESKVNQLKIRTAYGESGNFAPYGALFTSYVNTVIGGQIGIATPTTLGDPTIKPERQTELEVGTDLGLFNNAINLSFTWYNKRVKDLILSANIEPSTGFTSRFKNAGSLSNKGIEVSLGASPVNKENLKWDLNLIYFKNKSKITELLVDPFETGGFGRGLGTFRIEEGKSATQIVGSDPVTGGVVVLGDSEPDFQMSFSNNFTVKNFNLSFLWHWKKGGDNVNLTKLLSDFSGTSSDFDDKGLDPTGALANGPYRIASFRGGNARAFVEDASYIRLREIGLSYNFSRKNLKNLLNGQVSSLKIGFSGQNLINIFDYNSYDPEVSNFGQGGLSSGVEVTPFPSSKRYMFNLSFGLN